MRKAPDAIDRHVGARIRLRRNMLGVSQEKLAEGLGLTFQQVQKYEKGTNRVGASRLQHIAAILDTPISYFFEEAPSPSACAIEHQGDTPTELLTSKDCLALARAFVSIKDETVQQKVLSLVRSLGSGKAAPDALEDWVQSRS
ncbi:helix-turn-helix domain-containing protein (plasmid) [Agrobacterium sp. MA01]|uniref:helix-turn-helix domain-containing protein n=1 Tax=Agrobacterium sp. MA01 TaxID=2664893 RepID=UPI00129AF153|nr:helix-turn-helix transcriptional regulator [Agrobacterium sp. MA01]QGG93553.1 helix-turn-helix domain-containing protein [Agrobacterium sp. MA01]